MSDNPLQPNPEREARIRERAYHLWEADGRPHGRERILGTRRGVDRHGGSCRRGAGAEPDDAE